MKRAAVISECGKYRYRLYREWEASPRMPVMWLMLNPSVADANIDDNTIVRCIKFSQRWGYGAMWVGNVFAFRSTDPSALWGMAAQDARGPDNAKHLFDMAAQSAIVVCAWGNGGGFSYPSRELRDMVPCPGGFWCLGRTNGGSPLHPLARGKNFVPYDRPLSEFK